MFFLFSLLPTQKMATTVTAPTRTVAEIAREIRNVWSQTSNGINYAAKPYLEALLHVQSPADNYGADDSKTLALYFLSNAASFRGEDAKRLKAELKKVYGIK